MAGSPRGMIIRLQLVPPYETLPTYSRSLIPHKMGISNAYEISHLYFSRVSPIVSGARLDSTHRDLIHPPLLTFSRILFFPPFQQSYFSSLRQRIETLKLNQHRLVR